MSPGALHRRALPRGRHRHPWPSGLWRGFGCAAAVDLVEHVLDVGHVLVGGAADGGGTARLPAELATELAAEGAGINGLGLCDSMGVSTWCDSACHTRAHREWTLADGGQQALAGVLLHVAAVGNFPDAGAHCQGPWLLHEERFIACKEKGDDRQDDGHAC